MHFEVIPDWEFGDFFSDRIHRIGDWLLDGNYNHPGFTQAGISRGLYRIFFSCQPRDGKLVLKAVFIHRENIATKY